jgi:hypothetical protein
MGMEIDKKKWSKRAVKLEQYFYPWLLKIVAQSMFTSE